MELPFRCKVSVVMAAVRAALYWAALPTALLLSPWLGRSQPVGSAVTTGVLAYAATFVATLLLIAVFPMAWLGRLVLGRAQTVGHSARLQNVADGLAIAVGALPGQVGVIEAQVPNVGAFPTRDGTVVLATEPALTELRRDELEALVASQFAVGADRWVRLASAAQMFGALRMAIGFLATFVNPFFMPFAFLSFMPGRYADAVRDMVADATAVRVTRHPEALARGLRSLSAFVARPRTLKLRLPGFLVDHFWVLSTRAFSTTTTSVNGRVTRRWTTHDELRVEMLARGDRVEVARRMGFEQFASMRSWRRAVKAMGRNLSEATGA